MNIRTIHRDTFRLSCRSSPKQTACKQDNTVVSDNNNTSEASQVSRL
jgi:hypothetical protein